MSMIGTGFWNAPGMSAALETQENRIWWGLRSQQVVKGEIILSTTVDAGNSPTTLLRAGLLLGKNSTTGKCTIWDPTATNGTEHIYGVLLHDQSMLAQGATTGDKFIGWVLVGGNVIASSLLIPAEASLGINGNAKELQVRAYMTQTGRFILDDEPQGSTGGGWQRIINKTGNYTVLESDNNTFFHTEGASGVVYFTLPVMREGFHCFFYNAAAVEMKIISNPADTLIGLNDIDLDSITLDQSNEQIGVGFEVIGLASGKALLIPHLYEATSPTVAD